MRCDNVKLAISYGILAAFFYALLGTLMKITEQMGATNETIVFFRQLISFLALLPIIASKQKRAHVFKTECFFFTF